MSKPYYSILTNIGENLVAKATALGTKLDLTTMAVGDGNGKLPAPDPAQTKLINEKRRAAVNSLEIDKNNPNIIIVEHIIPETEGGWWVREIGLFDSEGNLIAVGNCPETYKPKMIEGSGRTQIIRMMLVVKSTECIELKSDPSVVLATREYVDKIKEEINDELKKQNSAESVLHIKDISFDTSIDNRSACYAFDRKIYIPADIVIRVNFEPEDDVRKFVGEGKILVKNKWTNADMIFDVALATNGGKSSVNATLYKAMTDKKDVTIGIVGDSITDGAWGKQDWTSPPIDKNGNLLAPISYNHSHNGGSHSWPEHWLENMNKVQQRYSDAQLFKIFNCSLSGARLSDGWGYRNFDFGFFGNSTYKNRAPTVCILAMGWNDFSANIDTYRDKIDMFVRKAWGYGCEVGIVTVNNNNSDGVGFEYATKKLVTEKLGIDYFNVGDGLQESANRLVSDNLWYYKKSNNTFDNTHPQELGQMSMGDSMFMQTLGLKYAKKVNAGDVMTTSLDVFWGAQTLETKSVLKISMGKASGTPELDQYGFLAAVNNAKNEPVKFTTQVYCEEDGMSLIVYEPWTAIQEQQNNTVKAICPSGLMMSESGTFIQRNKEVNIQKLLFERKIASHYFGSKKTLSTYAGMLRKGLNTIEIVYTGNNLTSVYCPMLKFGKVKTDGVCINEMRIIQDPNQIKPVIQHKINNKSSDLMIRDIMDGGN
ncbi:phage tail protein, partial [Providencia rettgeri]|nr:phage tail protein [Providencia rettgeri]